MSYYLVRIDRSFHDNKITETPLSNYGPYKIGPVAGKMAKKVEREQGGKIQVRRMAQAPDWRPQYEEMMKNGTMRRLPEKWDLAPIADHFAHLDDTQPGLICFIDGDEHGILGRITAISPGRYISRFYEETNDDHRRRLISAIDPSGELLFARTPDEITMVYKQGPESCMDGDHDFSDLAAWPTAAYAGGDLAVVYTKNNRGRIQSRAVCWPEKKVFGRTYGDCQRLAASLHNEGYLGIREDRDHASIPSFNGARLAKIENEDGTFVMPYFDDLKFAIDKGDHFEIVGTQPDKGIDYIGSGGQRGYSAVLRTCPKYDFAADKADFMFIHGVDEEWSASARLNYAFLCAKTDTWWPHEYHVLMTNRHKWSKKAFEEFGEVCSYSGENCPKDEMVTLEDGRRVHKSVAGIAAQKRKPLMASMRDLYSIDPSSVPQGYSERRNREREMRDLYLSVPPTPSIFTAGWTTTQIDPADLQMSVELTHNADVAERLHEYFNRLMTPDFTVARNDEDAVSNAA